MDTVTVESILIVVGREDDGRWWADIESVKAKQFLVVGYSAFCWLWAAEAGSTFETAAISARLCRTSCFSIKRNALPV
jgi:hypothetical protein